jgi:amino acid transporter
MLAVMTVTVLVNGGGPEGRSPGSLNPLNAVTYLHGTAPYAKTAGATPAVAGSAGIGLFFALCSWVGFESAAMYGEESKDPTEIISPSGQLYVLMALLGTTAILLVLPLAAFASIAYFHLHGRKHRTRTGSGRWRRRSSAGRARRTRAAGDGHRRAVARRLNHASQPARDTAWK